MTCCGRNRSEPCGPNDCIATSDKIVVYQGWRLFGMDTASYKEGLLKKRAETLAAGGGVKPLQETMGDVNSRQGDLADQASGNNEVHIQLKLKQTDAKILQAIEEALRRIE